MSFIESLKVLDAKQEREDKKETKEWEIEKNEQAPEDEEETEEWEEEKSEKD